MIQKMYHPPMEECTGWLQQRLPVLPALQGQSLSFLLRAKPKQYVPGGRWLIRRSSDEQQAHANRHSSKVPLHWADRLGRVLMRECGLPAKLTSQGVESPVYQKSWIQE